MGRIKGRYGRPNGGHKQNRPTRFHLFETDMNRSIWQRRMADLKVPRGLRLESLKRYGGNPMHTRRR